MLGVATNREPCLFFRYPEDTVLSVIAAHFLGLHYILRSVYLSTNYKPPLSV